MLAWAVLVAATLVAVEVACRLPLADNLSHIARNSQRAARVISANAISDHWKEKALPSYAMRILRASLMLFVLMAAVVFVILLIDAAGQLAGVHLLDRLLTVWGTVVSILVASIWAVLRGRVFHA